MHINRKHTTGQVTTGSTPIPVRAIRATHVWTRHASEIVGIIAIILDGEKGNNPPQMIAWNYDPDAGILNIIIEDR